MIQTNKSLVEEVSDYVFELFNKKLPGINVYHSLKHTEEVAENAKKIAAKMNLSPEDTEILTLAAWFHDTGFIERSNNHEDFSIEIAKNHLKSKEYDSEKLEKVIGCINATRYPQLPKNLLEEIIADADLYHLGTKEYSTKTDLLRMEWERTQNKKFSDLEWLKINIDFLTSHKYFTRFAKKNLEEYKTGKLIKLQKQYRAELKKEESIQRKKEKTDFKKEELLLKKDALDNIAGNSDIGIQNMINNSYHTQLHFFSMTDKKANVLIIINSFISIGLITAIVMNPTADIFLITPFLLILLTNLFCITYAMQVLYPVKLSELFSSSVLEKKFENSFFYDKFSDLKLEDFQIKLKENTNGKDKLFELISKDLYYLRILGERKYKYLRTCYKIFIYGMIISITAFAVIYISFFKNIFNGFQ